MVTVPQFVRLLLLQMPLLIVVIFVLVMSLVRWRRHPKASGLTMAGAIVLLAETVASSAVYAWLPLSPFVQSVGPAQVERIYDGIGLLDNVAHSIGLGLCFAAIFVGRRTFDSAFPVAPIPMASLAPPPPPQERAGFNPASK